jgi:hypothetical protein
MAPGCGRLRLLRSHRASLLLPITGCLFPPTRRDLSNHGNSGSKQPIAVSAGERMKEVYLKDGRAVQLDDEDYERVVPHSWFDAGHGYAVAWIDGKNTRLHRFILGADKNEHVHHVDGDKLNNQKSNLLRLSGREHARLHARTQLAAHRPGIDRSIHKYPGASSRYYGVYLNRQTGKWVATVSNRGQRMYLGLFALELEAAHTYDKVVRQLHGDSPYLNFPLE